MMYPGSHTVMYAAPTPSLGDGSLTVLNTFSPAGHTQSHDPGDRLLIFAEMKTFSEKPQTLFFFQPLCRRSSSPLFLQAPLRSQFLQSSCTRYHNTLTARQLHMTH